MRRTPNRAVSQRILKPAPACQRCGGPVPNRERAYCDKCLPHYQRERYANAFSGSGLDAIELRKDQGDDPTHGGPAAERRGRRIAQRKAEIAEWEARYGKLTDLTVFNREILPLIHDIPLSRLVSATGLSLRYCSQIRRGERVPHPRHWAKLAQVRARDSHTRE